MHRWTVRHPNAEHCAGRLEQHYSNERQNHVFVVRANRRSRQSGKVLQDRKTVFDQHTWSKRCFFFSIIWYSCKHFRSLSVYSTVWLLLKTPDTKHFRPVTPEPCWVFGKSYETPPFFLTVFEFSALLLYARAIHLEFFERRCIFSTPNLNRPNIFVVILTS